MKRISLSKITLIVGLFAGLGVFAQSLLAHVHIHEIALEKELSDQKQVVVGIKGYLSNKCYEVRSVTHEQEGNLFRVFLNEVRLEMYHDQVCVRELAPVYVEHSIGQLEPGSYVMQVGEVRQAFEILRSEDIEVAK